MSPTYKTASTITDAAREHGWEIVPIVEPSPSEAWGARKGRYRVMVQERKDGGLLAVWLHYPKNGGADCTYFPPRYKGKLKLVLDFLNDCQVWSWRQWWMTDEWLKWWRSLDHSNCAQYAPDRLEDIEEFFARPAYMQCRSMHCPDCGKPTGSQGHRFCPEREKVR